MTSAASQPPWWRVALGFLIAPLLPALAAAAVRSDVAPDVLFCGLVTALLGAPIYFLYKRRAKPALLTTGLASGTLALLLWLFLFPPDPKLVPENVMNEAGEMVPLVLWHFYAFAFAVGASTGVVFWLIVYGWRRTA